MRTRNPGYVVGTKPPYSLQFPVKHPPHCVCARCPKYREIEIAHRAAALDRAGTPMARAEIVQAVWNEPLAVRTWRASPSPSDRRKSVAAAYDLQQKEEARLAAAVEEKRAKRVAIANAVPFGRLCDAYREHLQKDGKRIDKDRHRIDNIESFYGRQRDVASIDFAAWRELLAEVAQLSEETQRHYASMLLAILNHAKRHRIIAGHHLDDVPLPQVTKRDAPITWTRHELAVIMGPAMDEFEKGQGEWNNQVGDVVGKDTLRAESHIPIRGLSLIAYHTLMRPKNNRALTWEELDEACSRFRLDQHKNVNRGIKARGPIAPALQRYLRAIRPAKASGPIHPNPVTGAPFVDIRKQWNRLMAIAERMLGYKLEGRKGDFFTFRHTGASHLAERTKNPVLIAQMMGDTSVATVMKHYCDLDFEFMTEMVQGWEVPQVETLNAEGEELAN